MELRCTDVLPPTPLCTLQQKWLSRTLQKELPMTKDGRWKMPFILRGPVLYGSAAALGVKRSVRRLAPGLGRRRRRRGSGRRNPSPRNRWSSLRAQALPSPPHRGTVAGVACNIARGRARGSMIAVSARWPCRACHPFRHHCLEGRGGCIMVRNTVFDQVLWM
jgi:hypothetical protein